MGLKDIKRSVQNIGNKHKVPCDPIPGRWNSCEPCRNCNKKANTPPSQAPMATRYELREDLGIELREDGSYELREN